ncbi:MAG TPA: hypothetical protein VKE51_37575 [Vicinamibacterales bacterium]|nr:hypothetical protein [Vicinamibacterales bacterium]
MQKRSEFPLAHRLFGTRSDGIDPSAQLRDRHDVQHRRRTHLHLHLRPRRNRANPTVLRQQFHAEDRRLV